MIKPHTAEHFNRLAETGVVKSDLTEHQNPRLTLSGHPKSWPQGQLDWFFRRRFTSHLRLWKTCSVALDLTLTSLIRWPGWLRTYTDLHSGQLPAYEGCRAECVRVWAETLPSFSSLRLHLYWTAARRLAPYCMGPAAQNSPSGGVRLLFLHHKWSITEVPNLICATAQFYGKPSLCSRHTKHIKPGLNLFSYVHNLVCSWRSSKSLHKQLKMHTWNYGGSVILYGSFFWLVWNTGGHNMSIGHLLYLSEDQNFSVKTLR